MIRDLIGRMDEIRRLFEPNYYPDEPTQVSVTNDSLHSKHDYSRFYYFMADDPEFHASLAEIACSYGSGCKLFCVFSQRQQFIDTVAAIDQEIKSRGLIRNRDSLEIDFEGDGSNYPLLSNDQASFSCFHCAFSLLRDSVKSVSFGSSFCIIDGNLQPGQLELLEKLDMHAVQSGVSPFGPVRAFFLKSE